MKVYHEGKKGHQYLFSGFEFIVYNVGRRNGKWFVHFISEVPEAWQSIPEQPTKTEARKLAEAQICQYPENKY